MYVRPLGKPESVPVPGLAEMREVMDLGIDKGVRTFLRRAGAAGVDYGLRSDAEVAAERYDVESDAAWFQGSEVLDYISERGHWDASVRAIPYSAERVAYARLRSSVEDSAVRLRGWPVPFVDYQQGFLGGEYWIGQDIPLRGVPHVEAWRMCSSGQFMQRRVIATEMRSSGELSPSLPGAEGSIAVWDILYYVSEVIEFASRMATTDAGSDEMQVVCTLHGMRNRQLISGDWNRELDDNYLSPSDHITSRRAHSKSELLGNHRGLAIRTAQELLQRFGLDVPDEVLVEWQTQLLGG